MLNSQSNFQPIRGFVWQSVCSKLKMTKYDPMLIEHTPTNHLTSYRGDPETDYLKKPFLSRFKNWRDWPCFGHYVRGICIFGIGDLPLLARRPEFFANKFFLENQTFPLQCMEELLFNRTRDEYLHQLDFVTDYYENLEFIKNVI